MSNDIKTIHSFRCDLSVGPCDTELHAHLMQQDALADVFSVAVFRGDETVDLTDVSVVGYLYYGATKQTMPLIGESSGHFALMTLTSPCYAQTGYASLVIQLQKDDVRHTVLKVNFCIDRTGSDKIIDPGEELPTLAELLGRLDELDRLTTAAREAAEEANAAREGIQGDLSDLYDRLSVKIENIDHAYVLYLQYPDGSTTPMCSKTQDEIRAAVDEGKVCVLINSEGRIFHYYGELAAEIDGMQVLCPTFITHVNYTNGKGISWNQAQVLTDNSVRISGWAHIRTPNPYNLLLKQGENAVLYDGSEVVEIEIPPVNAEPNKYLVTDEDGKMSWIDRTDTPSEVVILPETEIAVASDENPITTAPNAVPEVGAVCAVTYNGTAYDCPAVAIPVGLSMTGVLLGNSDAMDVSGGNATAPFVIMLFDTPVDDGSGNPAYGMFVPMEEIAEGAVVTLSIVQVGAASGGGSASAGGGGVFIVNGSASFSETGSKISGTFDKTIAEIQEAHLAGKIVQLRLCFTNTDATMLMMASMEQSGMIIWQGIVETMIVALFPVEDGVLQGQGIQLATLDA